MINYIKSYVKKNSKKSINLIKFRFNRKNYLNLIKKLYNFKLLLIKFKITHKLKQLLILLKKKFKLIKLFNFISKLNLEIEFLNKLELIKIKLLFLILIKSKLIIINFDLIKIFKYKFIKLNKIFKINNLSIKKFICNFYIKNYKTLNILNIKNRIYKIFFIENFLFFINRIYKFNKKIKIKSKNLNLIKIYIKKNLINNYKIKFINLND